MACPPCGKVNCHLSLSASATDLFAGDTVAFTGTATDPDGEADIASIDWDFGDGTTLHTDLSNPNALIPSHCYTVSGTPEVTLRVTDHFGAHAETMLSLTVTLPPIWIDSSDDNFFVGDTAEFIAQVDGNPAVFSTVDWDLHYDGQTFVPDGLWHNLADVTPICITAGPATVAVQMADAEGHTTLATFDVNIHNVPPTLIVDDDMTVTAGDTVIFSVAVTPANNIASVEWLSSYEGSDFEPDPNLLNRPDPLHPSYTFEHYGEYDFLVRVTDNNGESAEDGFHVTVNEFTPIARDITAASPVLEGEMVTFTGTVVDPDTQDTVTIYVDWENTGTFDQIQCPVDSDGGFIFTHVYQTPGTYDAKIRLSDDGGQNADYTVTVVVQPVTPDATLTTTSPWSWTVAGVTTWVMRPEDLIQFTDINPANGEGLEYHFTITNLITNTTTDTATETPTVALPDYAAGIRYRVEGYATDSRSGSQSTTQTLNVITGNYANGLWGTIAVQGVPPQPNADSQSINLPSNTTTTLEFTLDPKSLAIWPTTVPLKFWCGIRVYDTTSDDPGPIDTSFTFNIGSAFLNDATTFVHDDGPGWQWTVGPYPDNRRIEVTARAFATTLNGLFVGQGGPFPANVPSQYVSEWVSSPFTSLTFKTNQVPTLLQQLSNGLQLVRNLASQFGDKATELINAITSNPGLLLTNLLTGLQNAATQLGSDLVNPAAIRDRLYQWLVSGTNLNALSTLDFSSVDNVTNFLLQYAGLTWSHLEDVLKRQLGAGNYAAASKIAQVISNIDPDQGGNPSQILQFLQDLPSNLGADFADTLTGLNLTALGTQLLTNAGGQLTASLAQLAPRLLAKFVPGVGIATSLYQGLTFVLNNQQDIAALFQGLFNGMDNLVASLTDPNPFNAIANGDANDGSMTLFTRTLVTALEGPGLNAVLNFAMSQLGLGNLRTNVQRAIQFIPNQVDQAMNRMVAAIATKIVAPGSNPGGLYAGALIPPQPFTYNNQNYALWVARDRTGTKVKVAQGPNLIGVLTAASFDNTVSPTAGADLQALLAAANQVVSATKIKDMAANRAALTALNGPVASIIQNILNNSCIALNAGCFAAGTKLWTPQGYRNVEDIQPGDWVYSRDEFHPDGPITAKIVEKKFVRTGRILHIHLPDGRLIRTTPEHPFYEYAKGWVPAGELLVGATIRTDIGWTMIVDLLDMGEYELVYNVRVADYHTYFVGEEGWGWTVWAHNAYSQAFRDALVAAITAAGTFGGGVPRSWTQVLFDKAAANTHQAWYDFQAMLTPKSLNATTMRDLWWTARGQSTTLLATTQARAQTILSPIAAQIATLLAPFGITSPVFGIRGSLATGYSWDSTTNQQGRPWDGANFDVDAYVVSNQLASLIPGTTTSTAGTFVSLRVIDQAPGFRPGEPGNGAANAVITLIVQAQTSLRTAFGSRLRRDPFTFKVFGASSGITGLPL